MPKVLGSKLIRIVEIDMALLLVAGRSHGLALYMFTMQDCIVVKCMHDYNNTVHSVILLKGVT